MIIGITGASGVIYAIRLLETLKSLNEVETHLVMSPVARMNISIETDLKPAQVEALADEVHAIGNLGASIASGSFLTDGMIVAPCSMKALSAIVHSHADDLLLRAADVSLKERRKLVLMPRETPLHLGHCRLMASACELGAIIAPPMPAMYARPQSISDMVDHTVGRVLDLFGLDSGKVRRWHGPPSETAERS